MTDGPRPDDDDARNSATSVPSTFRLDQPSHGNPRPQPDVVRTLARGIGQTLITAGVVVLLFVVYEVYVTDLFGHQKQEQATSALDRQWSGGGEPTIVPSARATAVRGSTGVTAGGASGGVTARSTSTTKVVVVSDPVKMVTDPASRKRNYRTIDGRGFAKILIPKFGADYDFTVIEGTSTDNLYAGPGHYDDTQYPGEAGNFAIAGHRVSKGSPFNELGLLSSCDAMLIETQSDWFVYRVLPMKEEAADWATTKRDHCADVTLQTGQYADTFGREITEPSDYSQVLPVPHVQSTAIPNGAERLMTLTTCHPQFSDAQRMIVHGVLVKSYKKATGFLPPELNES